MCVCILRPQLSRIEQPICNSRLTNCARFRCVAQHCESWISLTNAVCSALQRLARFCSKISPDRRMNRRKNVQKEFSNWGSSENHRKAKGARTTPALRLSLAEVAEADILPYSRRSLSTRPRRWPPQLCDLRNLHRAKRPRQLGARRVARRPTSRCERSWVQVDSDSVAWRS
jgi:hypothetical protein